MASKAGSRVRQLLAVALSGLAAHLTGETAGLTLAKVRQRAGTPVTYPREDRLSARRDVPELYLSLRAPTLGFDSGPYGLEAERYRRDTNQLVKDLRGVEDIYQKMLEARGPAPPPSERPPILHRRRCFLPQRPGRV